MLDKIIYQIFFPLQASLPTLVAPFSSVLVSFPLQYFGRRKALIGLSIPGIIGFLLMGFTFFIRHKSVLYLGRLLTAIMGGAAPPAAQIYVNLNKIFSMISYNLFIF